MTALCPLRWIEKADAPMIFTMQSKQDLSKTVYLSISAFRGWFRMMLLATVH
jgi:hypothetical protein